MSITFAMIGIFVQDVKRMVKFYQEVVGLETDWDGQGPYVEFKHEGIRFSMFARSELPNILGQTPDYTQKLNGTFELAINVGDPANVDTKFQEMISKGAVCVYAPRNEPWNMRSSMIADPEGNLIEIGSDFWE